MQIAQVLSNYSLGEADLLRRAMGKKIQKEMDMQKSDLLKELFKIILKKRSFKNI